MSIRISSNNRKQSYTSFIFCPNGHKNVRGLDDCATCDMPLIDFQQELKSIIDMFENQNLKTNFGRVNARLHQNGQASP